MDTAFQQIRSHARSTQTRLAEVAAEIVAGRLVL
jgi:AmiR/NasT family two-component response regulator